MSVRYSLLGLLQQQPRYGYELRAAFTALAGGSENWDVKPAQIYTTLNRLQDSGLVQTSDGDSAGQPEKRMYAITPSGSVELERWLGETVRDEPQQDAFYLKLMLLLMLHPEDAPALIQNQRADLYQQLHAVTTQREALDPHRELARILLLDKAVMHFEADLRWLDMIEARLDEMARQPQPEPDLRPRGRPAKSNTHNQPLFHSLSKEKNYANDQSQ